MRIFVGVIIILFLGAGAFLVLQGGESETEQQGEDTFVQERYQSLAALTSQFAGKPLVINTWAVWCLFCKDELVDFVRLQEEFANEIVVIAINRAESPAKATGFTDSIGITDDLVFFLDPEDAFYKDIGAFTMPETVFIDSAGETQIHKRGPMELDEMREKTQSILN